MISEFRRNYKCLNTTRDFRQYEVVDPSNRLRGEDSVIREQEGDKTYPTTVLYKAEKPLFNRVFL